MPRFTRAGVAGIHPVHVIALFLRDHFQGQLVVVAEKEHPLAGVGNSGRLRERVDDRKAVFHLHGDEHAGHEGEVEGRMTFVAVAEVAGRVLRPLVRLGQQHAALEPLVHVGPQFLQEGVRFGKVLATGSLALAEIGHGVQPHPVHAHAEPVVHHLEDRLADLGIVEIEIGLMVVEAVPVIGVRDGIPRPVRGLEVLENDPRVFVAVGRLAPDVKVAPAAARRRVPRTAEPRMLVGSMIEHQFRDHAQAPLVRLAEEDAEIVQRAVAGVDALVIGNVVAVVFPRRGVEGQQPDGVDPQVLQVIELAGQAAEITDAVLVGVAKGADVELVDDGVFVPQRVCSSA